MRYILSLVALTGLVSALPATPVVIDISPGCATYTYETAIPSNTPLAFQSYSYCGGTLSLSAYIENLDYDKIVTVYYTDGSGQSNPRTVIQLGYSQSIDNNFEIWNAYITNINVEGIKKLINITYAATDINEFYSEKLAIAVKATGAKPTIPAPPVPYASPTGFSSDITDFLAPQAGSEAAIAVQKMFNNIQVTGAAAGTIVAAQSYDNPDYGYVRDSSLTMDVVASLYAGSTNASQNAICEALFFNYSSARAAEQNDPNLQTGLGEPKFNLNNSVYTGPWGRPQNDGPATAAITLMEFATSYLAAHPKEKATVLQYIYNSTAYPNAAPVMKDLLFVASNWSSPSFDLWEEEESDHFYTRMVQYRALTMGSTFAKSLGDTVTAKTLQSAATALGKTLAQFWDPNRNLLVYEYGGVLRGKSSFKDSAVLLALLHGFNSIYTYTNDKVLASAYEISTSFLFYPIASTTTDPASGLPLGIPVGRYPEDTYDGVGTSSSGNPWYLCTASMAEYLYRTSVAFTTAGKITISKTSLPFWSYYAPSAKPAAGMTCTSSSACFANLISALQGWGDAYMRTIKFYTPADGSLTEEIDRSSGMPVGAIDLTWSYASVLTASFARAAAMGDTGYVGSLAGLGAAPNATGVYGG